MARRLILGDAGGGQGYHFKVSKPGFDALNAPLSQLLFDARDIPFRFKRMPDVSVPANNAVGGNRDVFKSTIVNHDLGPTPWIVAIARPHETAANNAQWWVWKRDGNAAWNYLNAGGLPGYSWTTPWRQEGQPGQESNHYYGGWWHESTTNQTAFCTWGCGIHVKWGYLEI